MPSTGQPAADEPGLLATASILLKHVAPSTQHEEIDILADSLGLFNHEYFLNWDELPDEAEYMGQAMEYCFLAEIKQSDGFGRYRCIVEDREGSECVVAFYPDSYEGGGFDFKKLKRGHTLAIHGARQHEFLDQTMGVRVEKMEFVTVVPASLQALEEVGPEEEEYSVAGVEKQWKCHGCDASKPVAQMSRCGRCLTYAYCSKECQAKGWTERKHKTSCKVLRARHDLMYFTSYTRE
ncbi:hypothetical protein KVR01_006606 [Diaporthe batatas]|uniref:uncharacterized protein n=1 Tax=Diaporthe batatas TaxID=748121 RepID=UPI001D0437F6|nr:uncharacterized protein KVR01_006606 [Diaporthe batatas]KAG8163309.1 hypothetical protein KVR01_006606 [Diaporthe batatas]